MKIRLIKILLFTLWWSSPVSAAASGAIAVFPQNRIDALTIYASLAIFWVGIIVLMVVIRMKLREIERVDKLNFKKPDVDGPTLE